MAQGIMTGIGFLGAGMIFKEGLTVRGLTTAASIWVTAAIGILVGIGFWFAAVVGAAAALIVLALFRYIEARCQASSTPITCSDLPATKSSARCADWFMTMGSRLPTCPQDWAKVVSNSNTAWRSKV
jgi:uncharacterized membrane protein YhiD involved in acid resistance